MLDDVRVCTLAYYHNNNVTSCIKKKRLKKIVTKKIAIIGKIVIIEKDYDNCKRLWVKNLAVM